MNSRLIRLSPEFKVLLVNPLPSDKSVSRNTCCLGLGYLAQAIEALPNISVKVLDMSFSNLDADGLLNYLNQSENQPDIIGFTAMTFQANNARKLAQRIRRWRPEIILIAGGVVASARPDFFLNEKLFDCVFVGEADQTICQWLKNLQLGQSFKSIRGVIQAGDSFDADPEAEIEFPDSVAYEQLPPLKRELLPNQALIDDPVFDSAAALLLFSRGCPGNCIFCASPLMYRRRVRYRRLESMIAEIIEIIARYGIKNFIIDDDCFTARSETVEAFCREVTERKLNIRFRINAMINSIKPELLTPLKQAGCLKVTYGVETVNEKLKQVLGKPYRSEKLIELLRAHRRADLPATLLFIIGAPGETPETVLENLEFLAEHRPSGGWDFQVMQPHPGTVMNRLARTRGVLLTEDWDYYYSDNITYLPDNFSLDEFWRLVRPITGRPVSLSGHQPAVETNSFSADEQVISLSSGDWSYSRWSEPGSAFWQGDSSYHTGLTHFVGQRWGEVVYELSIPGNNSASAAAATAAAAAYNSALVSFRACSQNPKFHSELRLLFDEVELGRVLLPPKNEFGRIFNFYLTEELMKTLTPESQHRLTFRICPEPENLANGISIFSFALGDAYQHLTREITLLRSPRSVTAQQKFHQPKMVEFEGDELDFWPPARDKQLQQRWEKVARELLRRRQD